MDELDAPDPQAASVLNHWKPFFSDSVYCPAGLRLGTSCLSAKSYSSVIFQLGLWPDEGFSAAHKTRKNRFWLRIFSKTTCKNVRNYEPDSVSEC
jgi:hypothetical protein